MALRTGIPTLGALTLALLAASPASAQDLKTFRFGTNWVAQAEHGGHYQAVVDGTYAACGLDVEIVPGGPQVNGRALMLAGKLEAYMGGNMLFAFNALQEDIPLVVVAASFQKEPQVILTHPGASDSFEGLKALPTIFVGDNGFQSYYQWMISEFGFTAEQRKPYTYNPAPFLADKASGQQGYVTSEPFAIQTEGGFAPDVWLIADFGFDTYSTTIEMLRPTMEADPKAVECFVDGTAKGWYTYLYGDNAAANAKIQADNPDMSDEQIAFSIDALKKYGIVDSGDTETMGIGAMTDARMQSFYGKMVKAGVIPDGLAIKETYTLDFVNKGVGLDIRKDLTGQ
ncbi:MAG: ABC transporter substrate-binding protein [Pseudomonadota bacterium]